MTKRFPAVLVPFAVIAGIGCGGDSDTVALSKPQYLARGNVICVSAHKKQDAAFQKVVKEGQEKQASGEVDIEARETFIHDVAEAIRGMADELSTLGPPEKDTETVAQILEQYEKDADEIEEHPASYLTGNAFRKADNSAKAYGLTKCSTL
jgi:hypothetical protein